MQRKALGRGLEALIPKTESKSKSPGIINVPIDIISPGKMQPRKAFNKESLKELALSIKKQGVIQPIIVQSKNGGYELVAGERRWRAAQIAGIEKIPILVKELSDSQALEIALIENIQREDLNPIEEATVYKKLINDFNLTQESLSKRVGKNRSSIANHLRLLKLPRQIKEDLINGSLTMGHARALLALDSKNNILNIRNAIIKKGLSVRDVESLIKKNNKNIVKKIKTKDIFLADIESKLQKALGTRVNLKKSKKGGKIEIYYYSNEELNNIIGIMT